MQETWVRSLVWEDPTCHGATKLVCHNSWACALEPGAATTESMCCNHWDHVPRCCALQQEKPSAQLNYRVAPTHHNWREKSAQWQRPITAQNKQIKLLKKKTTLPDPILKFSKNIFRISSLNTGSFTVFSRDLKIKVYLGNNFGDSSQM